MPNTKALWARSAVENNVAALKRARFVARPIICCKMRAASTRSDRTTVGVADPRMYATTPHVCAYPAPPPPGLRMPMYQRGMRTLLGSI